ncbi:hypothetical protein [Gilliamella sp. Pas-s95]|uniref:hypothetical protein n=1 Tax=Gilliamella sp. Pas-s95 TaxID=2687317 RepID=UPI00132A5EDF|nr:hypothetical protein [Gilliamella sp. Pas-s95]MWN05731.1 hypothetical protein [Gilliamella sp. Pas-s95]
MAYGIWHMACQTYALNLFQFHRSLNQTQFLFSSPRLSSSSRLARSSRLSFLLSLLNFSNFSILLKLPSLFRLSKLPSLLRLFRLPRLSLFFALLLLSYAECSVALTPCSQALLACTSRTIEGSAPYLTFDGGQTRATSTDSLLSIKLQDGQVITPSTNTSSVSNPIRLPYVGNTLGHIDMIVPSSVNSVSLSDLVTRYNYWRDDDGDELDANGVSGSISVSFTDNNGNTVSRSDALDKCKAPYRVTLRSTGGYLQTRYGVPNRTDFSGQTVTYYINPYDSSSGVCYFVSHARPITSYGSGDSAGPADIWDFHNGFLTQSNDSTSYDRNFPTTGADGLYFGLEMPEGVDGSRFTWSPVTRGGITATVNWTSSGTKVTLSGPKANSTQINSSNPSPLTPSLTLPQTFELVGRDSSGNEMKYGFVLKQWFVNRGDKQDTQSNQASWCRSLGYRLARVSDLTNAKCGISSSFPCVNGIDSGTPSSSVNRYMRYIGASFFAEWGRMSSYADTGFVGGRYWTSDAAGSNGFTVNSFYGNVDRYSASSSGYAVCTAP